MLCATPLGVFDGGYQFIILPIWNPYGVLREKSLRFNSRCLIRGLNFQKIVRNAVFTGVADYFGMPFHI